MIQRQHMLQKIRYASLGVVLVLGLFAFFQRSLMYPAARAERLPVAAFPQLRQIFHTTTDVELQTPDQLRIRGWHLQRNAQPAQQLWLLFHGNGGHRAGRTRWYQLASQLHCDVLAIDYHGYGDSQGRPTQTHLMHDARAAWNHATQKLGLRPEQVIIVGESLGGAVAVQLAAETSRSGEVPGALVLTCTFDSMLNAARHHFPLLPVRWMLLDRWESDQSIADVACRILQFHGDRDDVVPLSLGQRLHQLAPAKSHTGATKKFVLLPGAGHNDLLSREASTIARHLLELNSIRK
jgi:hypothetical protein